MNHARSILVALTLPTLALNAEAIVTRHDRSDQRHIEFGREFDCIVSLGGGCATLIHPRWLLTAAHVAEGLSPFQRTINIGGEQRTVDLVVLHPTWTGDLDTPESTSDLALVRLDHPVEGIRMPNLYRAQDEQGQRIIVAGPGRAGDGRQGPTNNDGKLRAAENRIDTIEFDRWLVFAFDPPPHALDLEGISGPGDSGGPALIKKDGSLWIAGVSSGNDGAEGEHCTYGTNEFYARVSTELEWLDGVIDARTTSAPDQSAAIVDLTTEPWPPTETGQMLRSFVEAFNSADPDLLSAFESRHRPSGDRLGRALAERVQGWIDLHEDLGPIKPEGMLETADDGASLHASAGGKSMVFRFELAESEPVRFLGVSISITTDEPD